MERSRWFGFELLYIHFAVGDYRGIDARTDVVSSNGANRASEAARLEPSKRILHVPLIGLFAVHNGQVPGSMMVLAPRCALDAPVVRIAGVASVLP